MAMKESLLCMLLETELWLLPLAFRLQIMIYIYIYTITDRNFEINVDYN